MRLADIASSGNFIRIIELFPPGIPFPIAGNSIQRLNLSLRFDRLVDTIQRLESVADGFSLPELRNEERIHLNSVAVAADLKRRTGDIIIPTLTLRDSNRQNLLGSIAYSIFSGIENIFLVRGDPYSTIKNEAPKNVFDFAKISDFVAIIRNLETGIISDGKLCILSPIRITQSHNAKYLQTIMARQNAGVDVFVGESFFDDTESYFSHLADFRKAGIKRPIIHSIFPLKSYDDGLACIEKFGWAISKEELNLLKIRGNDYGVEMAKQRYQVLLERKKLADGVNISARGNSEFVRQITS